MTQPKTFPASLRFDLSKPWVTRSENADALQNLVLDHKEIQDECGDHSVAACSCGANRFGTPDHMFDWDRHFGELWNAALDNMGL